MHNFLNFQLASYLQAGRKKCNIGKNSLELAGNDVFLHSKILNTFSE